MLIDIGDDIVLEELFHMNSLLAVIFDRTGIEPRWVSSTITDFPSLLDIVKRLMKEPGRDPDYFLEVFIVSRCSTKFQAIQANPHALLYDIGVGEGAVCRQEHIGRFKVFFKPSDGGDKPLGINEGLPNVEGGDLDHTSLAHLFCDAFKEAPIEVRCRVLTELKGAERAAVIAALGKLDLD